MNERLECMKGFGFSFDIKMAVVLCYVITAKTIEYINKKTYLADL